jgi:hypothetical protein
MLLCGRRDKKVLKEVFLSSLHTDLCEIQVFAKIAFRSMRMEKVKRAM